MKFAPLREVSDLPPLFRHLSSDWLARLQDNSQYAVFKKGDVLHEEGYPLKQCYFGKVGWLTLETAGNVTGFFGPSSAFIDTDVRGRFRAASTLRARGIGSVIAMPTALLQELWRDNPSFSLMMTDLILREISQLRMLYARRNSNGLEVRLAYVMWQVGQPQPGGSKLVPRELTQVLQANLLGAPREEVNRKHKQLTLSGYLRKINNELVIDATTPMLLAGNGYEVFV